MEITIKNPTISRNQLSRPKVIAEIGCNHMGELSIAKDLIQCARDCGASVAKFQKRTPRELLSNAQYHAPHPVERNSYGKTYGAHREYLEFSIDQHKELKDFCESLDIIYSTSVWDMTSAREIVGIGPKLIKLPSATNLHFELLTWLCRNYGGEIHLSLGMTRRKEEEDIVSLFEREQRSSDLVLYACTSGYPVPMDDVCLLEVDRLISCYGNSVSAVGYSGHNEGIAIDMVAYSLGAQWIERHFTLDRTWKGTDHAASLEPTELASLVNDLENVKRAYAFKAQEILPIEFEQRDKLKWQSL